MNNDDRILLTEVKEDIKEIKECLLGSEYHPNGLVDAVKRNKRNIDELKNKQNKVLGFWGGAVTVFTVAITSIVNFFIFKD